jgi:hypothetical protein
MLETIFGGDDFGGDKLKLESQRATTRGGSVEGRKFVHWDQEVGHNRLFNDYFLDTPTYNHLMFRRKYRMRRHLFLRPIDTVCVFDPWFIQRRDALDRLGLSSLHKCTATYRMLAYGCPADACDEYFRSDEFTTLEAMKHWVVAI